MRLCVLIPSEEYRNFAGARIRYGRIIDPLGAQGWSLDLREIGEFDPRHSDYDIHIISKCHDARALICAHLLRRSGKIVGVDLFDDYFSQRNDPRLARYRTWLADLIKMVDFAMCSTPTMAVVARTYRKEVPVHVMNDPADGPKKPDLRETLERKLTQAGESRSFSVAWFGVGDNPNFPVGLSDLTAFGMGLRPLAGSDWHCRLKVLTNERALTADHLAGLRRLPLQPEISIWSEEAERTLLEESLLCFLPVNAQNFSMAKSLNRAVSALTAGCQVLSNGFPLYDRFEPLIYVNVAAFLTDLKSGALKLGPDTLPLYDQLIEEVASGKKEASALARFLGSLVESRRAERVSDSSRLIVIHGVSSTPAVHALAQKMGALSVGSPFCTGRFNFDALFRIKGKGQLALHVAKDSLDKLHSSVRTSMKPAGKLFGQPYWSANDGNEGVESDSDLNNNPAVLISRHKPVLKDMGRALMEAFGEGAVILSEMSALPLETTAASLQD